MEGIVVKSTGSWYRVAAPDGSECVSARLRGSLRMGGGTSTSPVVVGDRVVCVANTEGEWVIDRVCERRNYLVRRSTNLSRQRHIIAANIDTLYLVVSLVEPTTPLEFIDRVLVMAGAYGVEAKVVVNKTDLALPSDYFLDIYRGAGYEVWLTSAKTGEGIEAIRGDVGGKTVLFSGNSGVGKSSLLNAIDPTLGAKTGEISAYHKKGKHTTTFSEIFAFAGGSMLIDTPGVKGFGLVGVDREELWHYFPEMLRVGQDCGFYNCTHTHEPRCAVVAAVEEGRIAPERYDSYVKMFMEGGQESDKYR